MGKQKSFIIVGSTFLAVILILILIPVFTKGIKKSRCAFEDSVYYVEVGTERGIAPTVFASDKVKDLVLETSTSDSSVITVEEGTYAKGAAPIEYWAFTEAKTTIVNGITTTKQITKSTDVLYNENDDISVIDGYWAINGVKTKHKTEKDYPEKEIRQHAIAKKRSKSCYILNGIQTDILYTNAIPERNEETGTWFIEGKDSGIKYKGIQSTIKGLKLGEVTLTVKGKVHGEPVEAKTTIKVIRPDATGIKNNFAENTIVVKTGVPFKLDYKVLTHAAALEDASQIVDVNVVEGNNIEVNSITEVGGTTITAYKKGYSKIKVRVPENAFHFGNTENYNTTFNVVAINDTQDQVDKINAARNVIAELGLPLNSPTFIEKLATAKEAIEKVNENNYKYITNLEDYYVGEAFVAIDNLALEPDTSADTKAKLAIAREFVDKVENRNKISNIKKYNIANTLNLIDDIQVIEYTEECKAMLQLAKNSVNQLDEADKDKVVNLDELTSKIGIYQALANIEYSKELITVIKEIDKIKDVKHNAETKAAVDNARKFVDALMEKYGEDLPSYAQGIANIDKLLNAEKAYEAIGIAEELISKITKVTDTKECIELVTKAKHAVMAVKDIDKDFVLGISNFEAFNKFDKAMANILVNRANKSVKEVTAIDKIQDTVEHKSLVNVALADINVVLNYDASLKSRIKDLNKVEEAKEFFVTSLVNKTVTAIDSIGKLENTQKCTDLVKAAKALFDETIALNEAALDKITNIETLKAAEKFVTENELVENAIAAIDAVSKLEKIENTKACKDAIVKARKAVNDAIAFDEALVKRISNLSVLDAKDAVEDKIGLVLAEIAISEINKIKLDAIVNTAEFKKTIKQARMAVNEVLRLDPRGEAKITNLLHLIYAEEMLAEELVENAVIAINAIGEVTNTPESIKLVKDARALVDEIKSINEASLTDITNLEKLVEAEKIVAGF